MRPQPAVGVSAGTGEREQAGQVRQHAGDEGEALGRDAAAPVGVVEQILARALAAGNAPQAEVDVRAAAGLIQKRLGREGGDHAVRARDATHRLAHLERVVGGMQRGGVGD